MKLKNLILIVATMALAGAAMAQGQRGGFMRMGGGGGGAMLLGREDVQEDLKLTDEQKTKLADIRASMRDRFMKAMQDSGVSFTPGQQPDDESRKKMQTVMGKVGEEIQKEINAVLTADQQKRLKEIDIQLASYGAAANPAYQKDLNITDDQKSKIEALQKKQGEANRSVFEKVQSGEIDRSQVQEIMQKNQKALVDEIGKILTDDQKKKLKEMGGSKPFVEKKKD